MRRLVILLAVLGPGPLMGCFEATTQAPGPAEARANPDADANAAAGGRSDGVVPGPTSGDAAGALGGVDAPVGPEPDGGGEASDAEADASDGGGWAWSVPTTAKPPECAAAAELLFAIDELVPDSELALWAAVEAQQETLCASVGDVDGDGRSELLLGDVLFYNCGDAGFARAEMPGLEASWTTASAISDLDGDGVAEVILGDSAGSLHVRRRRADGAFDADPAILVTAPDSMITGITPLPDRDGDGAADLLYATAYAWPPLLFSGGSADFEAFAATNRRDNGLLFVGGDGSLTPVPVEDSARECGDAPSYAASLATRHHQGLHDLMWVAQMWTDDCLLPVADNGFPVGPTLEMQGFAGYGDRAFPMGVTHEYAPNGDVIFAVTDVGSPVTHKPCSVLWRVDAADHVEVELIDDISLIPAAPNWVCWGNAFDDFDLDGWTDFAAAHGATGWLELGDDGEVEVHTHPSNRPGGLALWLGGPSVWEAAPDQVPAKVQGTAHFGILTGDFFGNDGHGDGCKDVVLTSTPAAPTLEHPEVGDQLRYVNPVYVLRNTCADGGQRPFVGVRAATGDVGAIARLTRSDGLVELKPIHGMSSLTGTVEPSAVFGLPDGLSATRLELLRPDGEIVELVPTSFGLAGWLSP